MVEKAKETNGLLDFFEKIKNELSSFIDEVKGSLNKLFDKEIFKVTSDTQKNLKKLEDSILKDENEENILKSLLEKKEISDRFSGWLKDDSIDDDIKNIEKEKLLKIVRKAADSNDDKKGDLEESEFNNIVSSYESKKKLLDEVLNDENIKNKDPKVTKKQVLEIYNKLQDDGKTINKDVIIKELSTEKSESKENN